MKQTIKISMKERIIEVPLATELREIFPLFGFELKRDYQKNPIVAALVNFELHSLSEPMFYDCHLEEVQLFSSLGKRVYRRSICYLLALASDNIFPKRRLKIGHSLGDGYYFHFNEDKDLSDTEVDSLSKEMRRLVNEEIDIDKIDISYHDALEYFSKRNKGTSQTAELLKYEHIPNVSVYKTETFMDKSTEVLVYNTSILDLFELRKYRNNGMLLRYSRSSDFRELQPFKDNPLLFSVFKEYRKWNSILEMESIGQLNYYCNNNSIGQYIRLAETLQWKKISTIADTINSKECVKTIFIAGPSSSGKTTFTHKLGINLRVMGRKPILISLDNYYLPKDQVPLDKNGKTDLESLLALDIKQFQEDLQNLYKGLSVQLPTFNFKKNQREYHGNTVSLKENNILLIEGIHGLNPKLVPSIDEKTTFKVYISALTQLNVDDHNRISTTDNRILRRITRDHNSRGISALETLNMWDSVQRGENTHIFPFQNNADVMLNSALDYELGALKPFVEPLLMTIEPSSNDSFVVARRLLDILSKVYPIPSALVPKDSLLREFIGGSEFNVT